MIECARAIVPIAVFVFALVTSTIVVGKQTEFKNRFEGQWQSDLEKSKKYIREHKGAETFPESDFAWKPNLHFFDSGIATLTLETRKDESLTFQGNWDVTEEIDQNRAKVGITIDYVARKESRVAHAQFMDDDTLLLQYDVGPVVVMVRKSSFKRRIGGSWLFDTEKTKEYAKKNKLARVPPDDVREKVPFSMSLLPSGEATTTTRLPDGTKSTRKGTWELMEVVNEARAMLQIKTNADGKQLTLQGSVELLDNDTLLAKLQNKPFAVYARGELDSDKPDDPTPVRGDK